MWHDVGFGETWSFDKGLKRFVLNFKEFVLFKFKKNLFQTDNTKIIKFKIKVKNYL